MKEEYLKYRFQMIKTDLENNMNYLEPTQQLQFLNQQLEKIYDIGLNNNKEELCKVIKNYLEEQKKQESLLEEIQEKIASNANNIYEHLMKEL